MLEIGPEKLQDFRMLLLGDKSDESSDDLIRLIYKMASQRFLFIVNLTRKGFDLLDTIDAIPSEFLWVLDEVVIKRFNRIGSEGYESQSVEGHSVRFETQEFAEYLKDIVKYYDPGKAGLTHGKAVFF